MQPFGNSRARQAAMHQLRTLRDEFVAIASRGRFSDAAAQEWACLRSEHRMALLMLAGLDGDLGELAVRAWLEIAESERAKIRAAARNLQDDVRPLAALVGR